MIQNKTKGTLIAEKHKILKTFLETSRGLMGRPQKVLNNTGYIFLFSNMRYEIFHMFFVSFPIDVIFLNEFNIVVALKHNLTPFKIHDPQVMMQSIIEMKVGTIEKTNTQVGDVIEWN